MFNNQHPSRDRVKEGGAWRDRYASTWRIDAPRASGEEEGDGSSAAEKECAMSSPAVTANELTPMSLDYGNVLIDEL